MAILRFNANKSYSGLYIYWLALFTTLSTYGLIVLGGVVRATNSGLACPDWPRCHGELIPPMDMNIMIEYSHRLTAMSVGILIICLVISMWVWRRNNRPLVILTSLSLVLVIIQALIGAATVDKELSSSIVALHLFMALTLLSVLISITILALKSSSSNTSTPEMTKQEKLHITTPITTPTGKRYFLLILAIMSLILVGSYVSNEGAALVYPDWPLFDGKLIPPGGYLAGIHYAHRIMAAAIGLIFLIITIQIWKSDCSRLARYAIGAAFLLYIAQIFVGASNIWLTLATPARISHLALASAVWGLLILSASWHYLRPIRHHSNL